MAANYDLPEAGVVKRVRFFDGQLLIDQDFIDDQKYHIDRQRRTNRLLRTSGICEGLTLEIVEKSGKNQVDVKPGTALDQQGRLVVLSDPRTVITDLSQRTGELDIFISYADKAINEQNSGDTQSPNSDTQSTSNASTTNDKPVGAIGDTRWIEEPKVDLVPVQGGSAQVPEGGLFLGRVKVNKKEIIRREDREYSGVYLPNGDEKLGGNKTGPTLRSAGGSKPNLAVLTGDLSVTGSSTLTGALTVNNTVALKGAADKTGLNVDANGNVNLGGTLSVTGNSTLTGSLTVNNTVALKGAADKTGLSVDANGNVGMGGTLTVTSDIFLGKAGGGRSKLLLTDWTNSHYIRANDWWTEFVSHPNQGWKFISAGGSTDSAAANPQTRMQLSASGLEVNGNINATNATLAGNLAVTGTSTLTGNVNMSGTLSVTGSSTLTGNVAIGTNTNAAFTLTPSDVSPNAGYIRFGDKSGWKLHFARSKESGNGALNTGTTGTLMTIQDNGNLGIGTTNPQGFHVDLPEASRASASPGVSIAGGTTGNASIELRNKDAGTPFIDFSRSSTDDYDARIRLTEPGKLAIEGANLGIGVPSPTEKLEVNGNLKILGSRIRSKDGHGILQTDATDWLRINPDSNYPAIALYKPVAIGEGGLAIGDWTQQPQGVLKVTKGAYFATASGNVGIGTDNPTKAKLEIAGTSSSSVTLAYGWLNSSGKTSTASATTHFSLYANDRIAGSEFNAHSDVRLKQVRGRSNSQDDLRVLSQIEITDYMLKDKFSSPHKFQKKVLGQQIAQVFPQATSTVVDVVPDILRPSFISNGWITLNNHGLKIGEKIRIFMEDKEPQLCSVEATTSDQFQVSLSHEGQVFVYGREVDDFHVVDYDALSMLNISGTQELYKIIVALQIEVQQLKSQFHSGNFGKRADELSNGKHKTI